MILPLCDAVLFCPQVTLPYYGLHASDDATRSWRCSALLGSFTAYTNALLHIVNGYYYLRC